MRAILRSLLPLVFFLAILAPPVNGQYMRITTDNPTDNTRLRASGTTILSVTLDTNHDRNGSLQTCNSHTAANGCGSSGMGQALNLFGFGVLMTATGGSVSWGSFTPAGAFTALQPQLNDAHDIEFVFQRPAGTFSPPGLNVLGTISVTIESGSPAISFQRSIALDPFASPTNFNTICSGSSFPNTYMLGNPANPCNDPLGAGDWFDTDGVGPPSGSGAQAPSISAPSSMVVTQGIPADLTVTVTAANLSDSLRVSVTGLPPGLQMVVGRQTGGQVQARVYGIVDASVAPGSTFPVAWSASDGASSRTAYSTIRVEPPVSDAQFEDMVTRFYTVEYYHGLPRLKARGYGRRSLPILSRLLRDPSAKRQWHQIALGIGSVGDTAYFDTLRSFIWERFRGSVDFRTYMGLMQAQASLGAMATISPRVRTYLEATVQPRAWDNLPWYSPPPDSRESVTSMMRELSVGSISYTDSDWATRLLSDLSLTEQDPEVVEALSIGRGVNGTIRLRGLAQVWAEQDLQH